MAQQGMLFSDSSGKSFQYRPYQTKTATDTLAHFEQHSRGLGVLATGLGKTEIGILVADHYLKQGLEVLWITPFTELLGQTAARLRSRGFPCGIEQGGSRSDDRLTVASYKTLLMRRRWESYLNRRIGLIVVDEVHLNYSKRSMEMLSGLLHGGGKLLGLTASPNRMKGDPLTEFYGSVIADYGILPATQDGWLVPWKCWLSVIESLDLSRMRVASASDFNQEMLDRVLRKERVVQEIAQLVLQHHEGEPSVVFTQSIPQADMLADLLRREGLQPSVVHSRMEPQERHMHLQSFEDGATNIIINVSCLLQGYDNPRIRKLFIAKCTASYNTFLQAIGRGTRALPDTIDGLLSAEARREAIAKSEKPFFEIFDITDSSRHHSIVNATDILCPTEEPELLKRGKRKTEGRMVDMDEACAIVAAEKKRLREEQDALDALARDRIQGGIGVSFGNYARDLTTAAEVPVKKVGWRMKFGKHKGQLLRDIPLDYLQWLERNNTDRDDRLFQAIRKEIKRRAA